MVADAETATLRQASSRHAYRVSWVDLLIGRLERLPGPGWLVYGAMAGIGMIVANAIWSLEGRPLSLDPYNVVFGAFAVVELALIRHLDRVAAEALAAFRPLLARDDASFAELERRFTTAPWGPTAAYTAAWIGLGCWGSPRTRQPIRSRA